MNFLEYTKDNVVINLDDLAVVIKGVHQDDAGPYFETEVFRKKDEGYVGLQEGELTDEELDTINKAIYTMIENFTNTSEVSDVEEKVKEDDLGFVSPS